MNYGHEALAPEEFAHAMKLRDTEPRLDSNHQTNKRVAMARIQFLGGTGTVSGSRYLIETSRSRVLVDCGLFQGPKRLRERNWDDLPFDPAELDAVLLTHAHIDHSGYLPRLCKIGFRGAVFCTDGTQALLEILLRDSAYLQEEDARRANRYGYTKHKPAMPLFRGEDAEQALTQIATRSFDKTFEPAHGMTATFTRAGHIIGAACLKIQAEGTSITFSGDVGRLNDSIMHPPAPISATDYLVVESTYGDRRHDSGEVSDSVAEIVNQAVEQGGVILVPSFAVGRAQHLLHVLSQLQATKKIPALPVFLDSPMAINATDIFCNHMTEHRLSEAECGSMCRIARYTRASEDSKAIYRERGSMVIISASGMATGGRILHHLKRYLPGEKNTVLFAGHQAAGTRGRALLDGTDTLKIHGQYIPARARIAQVSGLSAHADYTELIDWLRGSELSPTRVFVTHGEPASSDAFRRRLHDTFGWQTVVPDIGTTWNLDGRENSQ